MAITKQRTQEDVDSFMPVARSLVNVHLESTFPFDPGSRCRTST
jgi:hypothetical protein